MRHTEKALAKQGSNVKPWAVEIRLPATEMIEK